MKSIEVRTIPAGFKVTRDPTGEVGIEYAATGMRGLLIFLAVLTGGMIFGCARPVYELYDKYGNLSSFIDAIRELPWWSWGAFGFMAFFPLAFGIMLLWFLFGRTRFRLSEEGLWVQKRLFFWQSAKFVPVETMRCVVQEKDGGQEMEDDSFATWKLLMKANRDMELLWKQAIDKSDWLGSVLAEKYGIPFISSQERE
jgi:hypothetical protein